MALFSPRRDAFDVHDEIAALRNEVAALGRSLSKHGKAALRDEKISDLGGELAERAAAALPVICRRAHALEETIRHNPERTLAVAGLAVLVVAAAVMLGGGRR